VSANNAPFGLLRRRCSGGALGEEPWSSDCVLPRRRNRRGMKLLLLLLLSVGLVLGGVADSGLSSFADSGVVRFVLLLLCERVADLVIPDVGLLFRIADLLNNGGSCFRSPAFGPVAADLLSPSFPAVSTADVRSVSLIRLGGWPGDGSWGSSKVLALLCKREGGTCLAPAFVSDKRERGRRRGPSEQGPFCIFYLFQGVFCNKAGMYCATLY